MLQDIKTAALTNGDAVKAQVAQTVASFRGSTGSIKDMVVTQLGDIRDRFQGPAQVYDSYRYTASMVLYAVGILFVALVLSACLANFQFGANVTTLLLCEWLGVFGHGAMLGRGSPGTGVAGYCPYPTRGMPDNPGQLVPPASSPLCPAPTTLPLFSHTQSSSPSSTSSSPSSSRCWCRRSPWAATNLSRSRCASRPRA